MRKRVIFMIVVALALTTAWGQRRPPEIGRRLPNPGPNRVEVRFALGEKAVECKYFRLTARVGGHIVMAGKFAAGFQIPPGAMTLPRKDALELDFKCRKHRWHFTNVGERAFLPGWWWVGTDYPPFQETFQSPQFADAAWIRYLIVDPTKESGFNVYKVCPMSPKNQKPGPCYNN